MQRPIARQLHDRIERSMANDGLGIVEAAVNAAVDLHDRDGSDIDLMLKFAGRAVREFAAPDTSLGERWAREVTTALEISGTGW